MSRKQSATMQERNKEIVQLIKDGYSCEDVANMFGIKRQRVNKIFHSHYFGDDADSPKSGLTVFQREKLAQVIFPNVRAFIEHKRITLIQFCESVENNAKTTNGVYRFLTGKSDTISFETLNHILDVIGMTFEEAFAKDN